MSAKDRSHSIKKTSDKNRSKEPDPHRANNLNLQSDPVQMDPVARVSPSMQSPGGILRLQHSLGNQAVDRLLGESSRSKSPSQLKSSQRPVQPTPFIQRVVSGDITLMSISDSFAWHLTDQELVQQIKIVADPETVKLPGVIPEIIHQNKAILDLEKSRRESPGLLVKPQAEGIATKAFVFWKGEREKEQKNPPSDVLKALSNLILDAVNLLLPHPCNLAYGSINAAGQSDQATWTITVNPDQFSQRAGVTRVGQLSKGEVAEIVDTIYHEARHVEQAFHIAQMKSGKGKSAGNIMAEMGIPREVAEHACAIPLKGGTKAEKKEIAEAESWDDVTARYSDYENWLQGDTVDILLQVFDTGTPTTKYNNLAPLITAMETEIATACDASVTKVKAIAKKRRNKLDYTVLQHSKSIRKRFNLLKNAFNKNKVKTPKYLSRLKNMAGKLYNAQFAGYFALVYEIDARKAGRLVSQAVRKQK